MDDSGWSVKFKNFWFSCICFEKEFSNLSYLNKGVSKIFTKKQNDKIGKFLYLRHGGEKGCGFFPAITSFWISLLVLLTPYWMIQPTTSSSLLWIIEAYTHQQNGDGEWREKKKRIHLRTNIMAVAIFTLFTLFTFRLAFHLLIFGTLLSRSIFIHLYIYIYIYPSNHPSIELHCALCHLQRFVCRTGFAKIIFVNNFYTLMWFVRKNVFPNDLFA